MKKRITVEQLQELTEEQQQRLREWWKPQYYDVYAEYDGCLDCYEEMSVTYPKQPDQNDLPLLDIGQMIDLLTQREGFPNLYISNYPGVKTWELTYICNPNIEAEIETTELCDALWQAVKQVI